MSLRRQSSEDATINLTPMIDVVFLLVIFFMVGSKFGEAEGQIRVNVPSVSEMSAISRLPDERVVAVDAQGQITLDGAPLAVDQLTTALSNQHAAYPSLRVAVRGDAGLPYQRMVDVFEAVRRSGVEQIGMTARRMQR